MLHNYLEHSRDILKKHYEEKLIDTGDAILAECAVSDLIWGIGISMYDDNRFDMSKWIGKGLLGFALMQVRDEINCVMEK